MGGEGLIVWLAENRTEMKQNTAGTEAGAGKASVEFWQYSFFVLGELDMKIGCVKEIKNNELCV